MKLLIAAVSAFLGVYITCNAIATRGGMFHSQQIVEAQNWVGVFKTLGFTRNCERNAWDIAVYDVDGVLFEQDTINLPWSVWTQVREDPTARTAFLESQKYPVEVEFNRFVTKMIECGHVVMILTACDPASCEQRTKDLNALGISVRDRWRSLIPGGVDFRLRGDGARFKDGIICSGRQDKGRTLLAVFDWLQARLNRLIPQQMPRSPSAPSEIYGDLPHVPTLAQSLHEVTPRISPISPDCIFRLTLERFISATPGISFVDDDRNNVVSVLKACKDRGVRCTAIHYTAQKESREQHYPPLADMQTYVLSRFGIFLSSSNAISLYNTLSTQPAHPLFSRVKNNRRTKSSQNRNTIKSSN
jgi:hypothetical protein